MLIPILLQDLNLDDVQLDQDLLAVLRQYLRTYTYMDAKDYQCNIEKMRKRILFQMPAVPLSKMLMIIQTDDNENIQDNDLTELLGNEGNSSATTEPPPRLS